MRTNNTGEKKKRRRQNEEVKRKKSASINKEQKPDRKKKINYQTYEGHKLTSKEARFIDAYMEHGNQRQAVLDAGFSSKAPGQYAQILLSKIYIAHEIEHRMEERHRQSEASGQEVMEFFAAVMRGEVKDQFGLDAPLGERIKAGQEIAKRTVDIANKIAGVKASEDNQVTIKLDWSRNRG